MMAGAGMPEPAPAALPVTAAQGKHCTALHLAHRLAVAGQVRILDVDTPGLVMPVSVFARRDSPSSTAVDTFRNCLVDAAALR